MNERNIYGFLNSDGTIKSWPEADINGRAVDRVNANRAHVDSNRFVVVPANMPFTDDLKAALLGGYDALLQWRVKDVPPVVGFIEMADEPTPPPPPMETFKRSNRGAEIDNS